MLARSPSRSCLRLPSPCSGNPWRLKAKPCLSVRASSPRGQCSGHGGVGHSLSCVPVGIPPAPAPAHTSRLLGHGWTGALRQRSPVILLPGALLHFGTHPSAQRLGRVAAPVDRSSRPSTPAPARQAFDVTRKATYTHLADWYKELRQYCENIPCIVVANKIDVDYQVTSKKFNFAKKLGLPFEFVSAADGTNVVKVFQVRWPGGSAGGKGLDHAHHYCSRAHPAPGPSFVGCHQRGCPIQGRQGWKRLHEGRYGSP